MKKYFALIFLLAAIPCSAADAPQASHFQVSVNFNSKDGKALTSSTAQELLDPTVTLPLDAPLIGRWTVNVQRMAPDRIVVDIFDTTILEAGKSHEATQIFHGVFQFQNGLAVPVLQTQAYNVSVTVTEQKDGKK